MYNSSSTSKHIATLLLTIGCLLLATSCQSQSNDKQQPGFDYRGLYTFSVQSPKALRTLNVQSPDYDWQLWGHNIKKAVGDNEKFYAIIDGKTNKEQYCFSSEALYKALKEYVASTINPNKKSENHYTIMPNDNWLVCQCRKCKKAGCEEKNATPAVTAFITRLAKDFPQAQFFTSSYNTVSVPEEKLPENVGVFLAASTIQLRTNFKEKKGFPEFDELLSKWKEKTDLIYIWDYCRNFDDYFTPYPCLEAMRAHLIYYKEKGVSGVFLNGSGPDFSTFDDLQTSVLAQLLQDPSQEIEPLVNQFLKDNYPKTQEIISSYYVALEDKVKKSGNYLPLYGEIDEAMEYYFQPKNFELFRKELEEASKNVEGTERKKLNLILTALNYTRMQLMKEKALPYSRQDAENALEVMKGALEVKEMQNYKEANGKTSEYIKKWEEKVLSTY